MTPPGHHPRRRLLPLLLGAVMLALISGCVSLPDAGPVQSRTAEEETDPDNAPYFDPPAPTRGASPVDIVEDFLLAMTANPLTTATAREYLTAEASARWVPEQATVVYGSKTLASPTSGRVALSQATVTMQLAQTSQLDARGKWLGRATGAMRRHELELVREKGEWRITNPPNALMVPESHFESFFRPYSLYFFDKSAQILVPEPVYLPRGSQTPTLLMKGLLQGPEPELLGVIRTFIPAGAQMDLSVPVRDGTAEVPLSDEVLDLSEESLQLASAQVSWTLRQVTGVRTIRITVDGSPLDVPGVGAEQQAESWAEFDPRVNWASEELFGLRDGHVVTLVGDEERRIAGLFGSEAVGLRDIAVDLAAEQVVGVSSSGRSLLLAPRARSADDDPDSDGANLIHTGGTDLLQPSWDIFGQVWTVDNTSTGAVVSVIRSGVATEVDVRGISGERVKAFEMSRDGTRLAAIVDGGQKDEVRLARVLRRDDGRVRRVAPSEAMPLGDLQVSELRDFAWRTPENLAVLTGPTSEVSQVVVTRIDGSSATGDVASNAEIFRSEASEVVTSPASGAPLYVGTTGGQLFELAATGRWIGASIRRGLASPTFVG